MIFIKAHTTDTWKGALLELEQKQIEVSSIKNGLKLEGYGFSVIVQGYDKAEQETDTDEKVVKYRLSEKKEITLFGAADYKLNNQYDDQTKKSFELATGIQLDTEYNWMIASMAVTPNNFSLSDNAKNYAIAKLLTFKARTLGPATSIYKFDNGVIKGTQDIASDFSVVQIFSNDDLNTRFMMHFIGDFTQDEVDTILSTVTFN